MKVSVTHIGGAPQDAYRNHLLAQHLRPETIRAYTGWVRRLSADCGDPLALDTTDLEQWIASHRWAPQTHSKCVQALKGFYRWALSCGMVDADPSVPLRPARVPRPIPQPCPEAMWRQAIDHATGDTYWRLRLAGDTGLRRAELAAVHSADVTELPSGPALRVDGKGGKLRYVPVPDDLAQWVTMQRGYVFDHHGKPQTPGSIGRWYARHVGVHAHALRHRYASRAYAASHDIEAVRDLLGHASVATTQGYVRIAGDSLAAAARGGWDHAA